MTSEKITTEELISRYDAGERDFRGVDLSGADLAGAYLARANLAFANLSGADLAGAYLEGVNLWDADLRGANLSGAYLHGADLEGAYLAGANLIGANLSGADLEGADLEGADLAGAKLAGAIGLPEIEPFPIDAGIAEAVADGAHLDMGSWHNSCGTAHCRAGWAVTLHPQGKKLEVEFGTNAAAALIYNACSNSERTPNWYADNAAALADIRRLAELAAKVVATPADVKGTP
jgi:hypothetical protein